jgi:hypothetical protein
MVTSARCGFVGDEDFRPADQGHGNDHALPHSAAEFEGTASTAWRGR